MFFAVFLNSLIKYTVPIGFLVWSFFNVNLAIKLYLALVTIFSIYAFFLFIKKPKISPDKWNEDEIYIIRKYHVAMKFPNVARDISCHMGAVVSFGWVWVPWLLYNQMWYWAAFFPVYYFLVFPLARRFDPHFHLNTEIEAGNYRSEAELSVLVRVKDKLWQGW